MRTQRSKQAIPTRLRTGISGLLCSSVSMMIELMGLLVVVCLPAYATAADEVRVEVRHVGFDQNVNAPVVILEHAASARFLPIWIGSFEARAIAMQLEGIPAPRPLTHDLMKNVLEQVGVQFQKVIVSSLEKNTYFARMHLTSGGQHVEIDSRPSDAIALALRFDRPIFVARSVFEASGEAMPTTPRPISTTVMGIEVQDLTTELAEHFQLKNTDGVLVTDSPHRLGELERGDVILALDGKLIRNVSDFQARTRYEKEAVRLLVRRSGRDIRVRLAPK